MGKVVVNVTQCPAGRVDMKLYATGKNMEDSGVVSGYDSTTEAMLSKLFHILGNHTTMEDIKALLSKNLKGEITTEFN